MKKRLPKIVYYRRRITLILLIVIFVSLLYSFLYLKGNSLSSTKHEATIQEKWDQATNQAPLDRWNLVLVNEEFPLKEEQKVKLVEIDHGEYIDQRIEKAYLDMCKDARKEGYDLAAVSGYRSIDYQTGLFNTSVAGYLSQGYSQEEAEKKTQQYVQIPGSSEHQTGLAIDIASEAFKQSGQDLTDDLEETPEYQWLLKHAADYGFILRYPKGKEKITKIGYEPWHFRYVGKKEAKFMEENDLTLEELHQKLLSNPDEK